MLIKNGDFNWVWKKKKVQNIFTIFFDYRCNLDLENQWSAWFHSPNRIKKDSGEINEDLMIWNFHFAVNK